MQTIGAYTQPSAVSDCLYSRHSINFYEAQWHQHQLDMQQPMYPRSNTISVISDLSSDSSFSGSAPTSPAIPPLPTKRKVCIVHMYIFVPCTLAKVGDIKTHSSVCHKNFNLAYIFWSINDRALMLGMHDPCVKPFQLALNQNHDLWPFSRSNLLPSWEPQFSEFACFISINSKV